MAAPAPPSINVIEDEDEPLVSLYEDLPRQSSGDVDDLAQLVNLTEQTLLEEIKVRYDRDVIYTFVSDILIAVNPFKTLGIYTEQVASKYRDIVPAFVPPHVFVVADQSYHNLAKMKKDQCIVISGESGAGKTESAKKVTQHIIRLCRTKRDMSDKSAENDVLTGLEDRIIKCSPVLEAFGNAQTVMNDNSSRFGKYTQLLFSQSSNVMGVQLSTYLLEKSRVMEQDQGERNFHVFYYLFADESQRELYKLTDTKAFSALSGELWDDNTAMNDELIEAIKLVGFSDDDKKMMFSLLAAVLHLSNILFEDHGTGNAAVQKGMKGDEALEIVATCLGVDADALTKAMLTNETVTRGETIVRPYNVSQAYDCRDALAKSLYGSIFGWIVGRTNEMLAPELHQKILAGGRPGKAMSEKPAHEIGVLDIFGFENFETNSFEQMCINLAHEQLQYFFNRHTFKIELEEYEKEGIDVKKISFKDNLPLIDMFLGRPIGILALLDEESSLQTATDQTFVGKVNEHFDGKNDFFQKPPAAKPFPSFGIKHFAAHVDYNCSNFLDKNRDNLAGDLVDILCSSNVQLVQDVFLGEITPEGQIKLREKSARVHRGQEQADPTANKVHRKSPTLGAQFKSSLKTLIDRMTACYPHFIRCIKPNHHQQKDNFIDDFVTTQLRYTGVLEATRIRQEGYSWRPEFADFVQRYKIIAFETMNLSRVKLGMGSAQKILEAAKLENYHIGKTKLFLKHYHLEQLERALQNYFASVTKSQAAARGFLARKRFKKLVARKAMAEAERAEQDRIEAEERAAREAKAEEERRKKEEMLRMETEIADKEAVKAEEERKAAELRAAEAQALAAVSEMEAKIAEEKARLAQIAQQEALEALEKEAAIARAEKEKAMEEALKERRERAHSKAVRRQEADEASRKAQELLEQQKKEHEATQKKLETTEQTLKEKLAQAEEEARKLREEAEERARKAAEERAAEEKRLEEEAKREAEEAHNMDYTRADYDLAERVKQLNPEATIGDDITVKPKKIGGFIKKLGGSVRPQWQKRWLEVDLETETMKYAEKEGAKKDKNSFPLSLVLRCFKPDEPMKKHAKHPNMFMIETPERTFFCRAPSEGTQEIWVSAISDFVNHRLELQCQAEDEKRAADGGGDSAASTEETSDEKKEEEKEDDKKEDETKEE